MNTMKKNMLLLAMLLMAGMAMAQEAVVDIVEQTAMMKSDATLGKQSVAMFVSNANNLVISSSNPGDVVSATKKTSDGRFLTEVACDLSDRSVDANRTFSVLIKGTSLKGTKKKAMAPGRRYYFLVTEAEHMLTAWWPQTKDILYPVAGKACVEFNLPQTLDNMKLKFSDGIGGKMTRRQEKGMSIVALEVDCKLLQTFMANMEQKEQKAAQAQRDYEKVKADHDARCNEEGFDFDAAEKQEQQLEALADQARQAVPQLYVVLYGDKSNELPLSQEKIAMLTQPKYKLTVGVNDALQKTVVGTTALAEKMKSANMAYQSRRFKEAANFYEQAAEDPDATQADKAACAGWLETINKCIEAQTEANKALLLLKNYKEKGGEVNPDKIVELYDIAINNYETLYIITNNDFYQTRIDNFEASRSKIGYVMSGTVIATDFKQGVLHEDPITGIDIYAVQGAFTNELRKGTHGEYVGKVDDNGKFHVEVARGVYDGLLFVPAQNKKFSKNVWQSIKGSKHLDIKVIFTKDH